MKALLSCGASGGHIYPAIALAEELKNRPEAVKVVFTAGTRTIDKEIFKSAGHDFFAIPARGFPGKISLGFIDFLIMFLHGLVKSFVVLIKMRPDIVVGFGGYTSFPVVLAARVLRIPVLLHEQNVSPGLANRIAGRFADKTAVSFKESLRFFEGRDVVFTGNPVRKEITACAKGGSGSQLGLLRDKFTLLVLGGSQGSRSLNKIMMNIIDDTKDFGSKFQVIHLAGEEDSERLSRSYAAAGVKGLTLPFLKEIGKAYKAADLVISRAGATTISEIKYLGKPAILVPYPYAGAHQRENAAALSREGSAILLDEAEAVSGKLREGIMELFNDRTRLKAMALNSRKRSTPDAAKRLGDVAMELIAKNRGERDNA